MEEQEVIIEQESKEVLEGDSVLPTAKVILMEDEQSLSGNELIDATQNAIVGVAENVSEALTLTEKKYEIQHENIPLYMDVEFWVGMSFVLVVLMIAKPVWRAVRQGLQNSIQSVIDRIDEAVKLRDDAQKLLSEYEKRCNDLNERIAQISEQTQKNIVLYRERELKNLQRELDKKQKEVQARIERSTQNAKDEINSSLSLKTIDLAQKAIEKCCTDEDRNRLIDDAISALEKFPN